MSCKLTIQWLLLLGLIGPLNAADDPPSQHEQQRIRAEVARLLAELDSDQFEVRRRAAARLEALVARPELGRLLSAEFQRALADLEVSFEVRWHLKRWCRQLPEIPPETVADVSPEEIDQLVRKLDDDAYAVRLGATGRLESLLFQDEHLPQVTKALRSYLAGPLDAETAARVEKLLQLTRPAMVAEYWEGRRHLGEQHLWIGVPSMSPGAVRPSHFDRIDDQVARCVSGSNLSPGDYPVGVAIPHPNRPTAIFHLVNLPTPRRRMAYKLHVQTDHLKRLAELSRRTLDRVLAERRELSERELIMLAQLDPKEVSRFAARYFHLVDDRQLPPTEPDARSPGHRIGGRPSRFGMICRQLAADGTNEAIQGLLEAINQNRFLPPTSSAPHRYHWLAALSIATRDPWPKADDWLATLIGRKDSLVEGRPDGPELGATAAGLLLKRHQQQPARFRLQPAAFPSDGRGTGARGQGLAIEGYRFPSAEARKEVQQWWQQEAAKKE
jgi:hypothetical protein